MTMSYASGHGSLSNHGSAAQHPKPLRLAPNHQACLFLRLEQAPPDSSLRLPRHILPSIQNNGADSGEDADLPRNPLKSDRFSKILERKRREREAREAEEAQKKATRLERATADDFMSDGEDNITDDDGGRKLTQEATRPTRKASKKAMEEMNL